MATPKAATALLVELSNPGVRDYYAATCTETHAYWDTSYAVGIVDTSSGLAAAALETLISAGKDIPRKPGAA
jgi:hypothetical protein